MADAAVMEARRIPLSRVHQSEQIERRILGVVKNGNYILGPECKAFEQELAVYFGDEPGYREMAELHAG